MAKIQYSIKVEKELLDKIKEIAAKDFRSVNNTIELSLREYIASHPS